MLSSHTALHGAFCVMALVRLYRGFCVLAGTSAYLRWVKRLIRALKSLQCYTGNTYTTYEALHTELCHSCVNCLDMAPVCPYTECSEVCTLPLERAAVDLNVFCTNTALSDTQPTHNSVYIEQEASAFDLASICQDDKELSSY